MSNTFGYDGMDRFSRPISSKKTNKGLGSIYVFNIRTPSKSKPGRSVIVLSDDRLQYIKGFVARYAYVVKMWKNGVVAGNHYHKEKNEIFTVLSGKVYINLQDVFTRGCIERIVLSAPKEQEDTVSMLYVPAGVAHSMACMSDTAIVHILATHPNTNKDEFKFEII